MTALPTRRDEAWRYADLSAAEAMWAGTTTEAIRLNPREIRSAALFADDDGIRDFTITLDAGARYDFWLLNLPTRYSRVTFDVTLLAGASFNLFAAQIAGEDATAELITTFRHIEPGATSSQTVRSVLAGKATGTYLGKVAVARGAQQTDSAQSVKAMLLDRTATANAKPELEIYADDVKCAHGCAIGELDAMGLFYLESRGLAPAEAKKLMLQAFVAGVFEGASEEEALTAAALKKLGELV